MTLFDPYMTKDLTGTAGHGSAGYGSAGYGMEQDRIGSLTTTIPCYDTILPFGETQSEETSSARRLVEVELIYPDDRGEQKIRLESGQAVTVGRTNRSEYWVESDIRMSRTHFSVQCTEDHVFLVDQGSTNGTFANGKRVQKAELRHGDHVLAGTTLFEVNIIRSA